MLKQIKLKENLLKRLNLRNYLKEKKAREKESFVKNIQNLTWKQLTKMNHNIFDVFNVNKNTTKPDLFEIFKTKK